MFDANPMGRTAPTYVVCRRSGEPGYSLWQVDLAAPDAFRSVLIDAGARLPPDVVLRPVGGYVLAYSLAQLHDPERRCCTKTS